MGEYDCDHDFIDAHMAWADAHGLSYLAWTCESGPSVIADYGGTPTRYGKGLRDHLAALAARGRAR
jgi:hypothetical protein